jgi:hypothetical protein
MSTHIMLGEAQILGQDSTGALTVEVTLRHAYDSWVDGYSRTVFEAIVAPHYRTRTMMLEGLLLRESDADLRYTRFLYRSGLYRHNQGQAHVRGLRVKLQWELETLLEQRVAVADPIIKAMWQEA